MNAEEIFQQAIEMKSPAERDAWVVMASGDNAELLAKVQGLLKAHAEAGKFLDQSLFAKQNTTGLPAASERPGTIIGPYKLLQKIGEGGMGVVFMAEQMQPIKRMVALKVIKAGMDSSLVIARFEAERQALSMMDHVNIARVFDGGTIPSPLSLEGKTVGGEGGSVGRPFFVMELINGVPITKYCDDNHLSPRERLELFIPVCRAIQHAHQKGIIHRDIKPTNVMITLYDGKPVPKVIDFGVAKATEQKLTERTLFTQYGTMVGTLEYMSPEQAEMNALGVDTRSDIYSLGVLLYELLTGTTPLERKRIRSEAYAEILRIIKEEDPPRPSTRLSNSGEALASISAQRQMEPAKLTRMVRGELDWIVMKCLEKDRSRRYETANAFANDVQCYLNDESVQACPPSNWYRFRKFARRNKAVLSATAIITLALVLGTGISIWQAIRATDAEHLAEKRLIAERQARADLDKARHDREQQEKRINSELSETLVEAARLREKVGQRTHKESEQWSQLRLTIKKTETLSENTLADRTLVERAKNIVAKMKQEEADRQMILRLESIYLNQGSFNGHELFTVSGGSYEDYDKAFKEYGLQVFDLPPDEAARRIAGSAISEALVAALDDCASNDQTLCQKLMPIAQKVHSDPWRRQYYEARSRHDTAAIQRLSQQPAAFDQSPATLCMLAQILFSSNSRSSVAFLREAQRRYPDDLWINLRLAEVLNNVVPMSAEEETRLKAEALAFARVALAARPESPALHNQLVWFLVECKQWDEALAICQRSIQLRQDNPSAYRCLGYVYRSKGEYDAALAAHRKDIALDPNVDDAYLELAKTLAVRNEKNAAIAACQRAIALKPANSENHLNLGEIYLQFKDYDNAVTAFSKVIALSPDDTNGFLGLGNALSKKGDTQSAISAFQKAVKLHDDDDVIWSSLGDELFVLGDMDGALDAFQKAVKLYPKGSSFLGLSLAHRMKGNLSSARTHFEQAIRLDNNQSSYFSSFAYAHLAAGDRQGFQKVCSQMLTWHDETSEPVTASIVLRTFLSIPGSLPEPARLQSLSEIAAKDKNQMPILAATLYRTGKIEAAAATFEEAAKHTTLAAWDYFFQAMAYQRLQQPDKARKSMTQAITLMTKKHPWLEAEQLKHLRVEAEELLKQK